MVLAAGKNLRLDGRHIGTEGFLQIGMRNNQPAAVTRFVSVAVVAADAFRHLFEGLFKIVVVQVLSMDATISG